VCSIRVIVNASEERRGRVPADVLAYQVGAAGVLVDECRDVVNETADEDQRAEYGLFLERFPADDGQVIAVGRPGELLLRFPKTLELHRQLTFTDFVVREDFQMTGQSKPLAGPNEPLRRVVLVPLDSIPVIHRELVVEIVVPFTDGAESGDEVVSGCVFVIERTLAQPVREGVDAECAMMNKS